jgi:2,4-dienoyl-CoA reductase-like NADH-dependent reductase (Old Yellow Enzyme family)
MLGEGRHDAIRTSGHRSHQYNRPMQRPVPDVLEPLLWQSGQRIKNRAVVAAMTNQQSHADGTLSDDELAWLTMRAAGEFGIVTTCAAHVAKDGQGWAGELGVFADAHIPGLTRLAGALKEHGALALTQIFHGGLRADGSLTGERPWSASESEAARAATEDDIHRVIGQFADAAGRARTAGMDGVEIHGAHGYLLTQFLSVIENRRQDGWGGPLENRARLLREVTRAVRARAPAPFLVGVRLSPEDFGNAKGLDLDESLQVARWLGEDGVDFVHLSLWRALESSTKRPFEHAVTLFREALPSKLPIFVAGGLWTRADAQRMLTLGADLVAFARAAICNPDWPARLADPTWEPRRPPLTVDELRARGLSPGFVTYMGKWKGFVSP